MKTAVALICLMASLSGFSQAQDNETRIYHCAEANSYLVAGFGENPTVGDTVWMLSPDQRVAFPVTAVNNTTAPQRITVRNPNQAQGGRAIREVQLVCAMRCGLYVMLESGDTLSYSAHSMQSGGLPATSTAIWADLRPRIEGQYRADDGQLLEIRLQGNNIAVRHSDGTAEYRTAAPATQMNAQMGAVWVNLPTEDAHGRRPHRLVFTSHPVMNVGIQCYGSRGTVRYFEYLKPLDGR